MTGKGSDWPRVLKWEPFKCKISRVKGSEEEEEDLLTALWELEGAVEQRGKAWQAFEKATMMVEMNGKEIRVDRLIWERAQGRKQQ